MLLLHTLPVLASLAAGLTIESRQSGPTDVQVTEIAFSGTGCGVSTTAVGKVSDPINLKVPEKRWTVLTGANNSRAAETHLNCEVLVKVSHPSGWQFSVSKADYYGRVKLPQNSEALSKTWYSFPGVSKTLTSQYYFDGPFDGLYFKNDRYDATTGLFSPCGTGSTLNITSDVKVAPLGSGTSKPASMEIFNLWNGKLMLNWKKCT